MYLNNKKNLDRLGIFFFYDAAGVVDSYVINMLNEYSPHFSEILTVSNGSLTEDSVSKLRSIHNNRILIRENIGFDVWAYRAGLFEFGWDRVKSADELIMFNYTIIGPIDSFEPMFSEMNCRDVDFWGITIHNGADFDPWGTMPNHKIPLHIQSHFIAIRGKLLNSTSFFDYWNDIPMINKYEESVALHEAVFTDHFARLGYKWDVYVNTWDLVDKTFYPLFNMPVDLIENRKCPIFKRKIFIYDFENTIEENGFEKAKALYSYLKYNTPYNTDMLDEHILRTSSQKSFVNTTNLHFIIEKTNSIYKSHLACVISKRKYDSLSCSDYDKLSKNIHKIIILDNDQFESNLLDQLQKLSLANFDYILVLDETTRISKSNYQVVDTVYSSRDTLINNSLIGDSEFINGIIDCFEQNNALGMLVPPNSVHSFYFTPINNIEIEKFESIINTIKLNNHIEFPINKNEYPLFPKDNCFWIRSKTVLKLNKYICQFQNGALSQFYYLLMPYLIQKEGGYVSWCTSIDSAENLLTYMYMIIDNINASTDYQQQGLISIINRLKNSYIGDCTTTLCEIHYDIGYGFNTKDMQYAYYNTSSDSNNFNVVFTIPSGTRKLRFDPIEGHSCICRNIHVNNDNLKIYPINGYRINEVDIFFNQDPQYLVIGNFESIESFSISIENMYPFILDEQTSIMIDSYGRHITSFSINDINLFDTLCEAHFDTGNGYNCTEMQLSPYFSFQNSIKVHFDVPQNTKEIRFDPIEGCGCICYDTKVSNSNLAIEPINGLSFGLFDIFLSSDPQYRIIGQISDNSIEIEISSLQLITTEYISNKSLIKTCAIFYDNNNNNASHSDYINFEIDEESYKLRVTIPYGTKSVRINPLIGNACICKGVKLLTKGVHLYPINGYRNGDADIFFDANPQYILKGSLSKNNIVDIEFASIEPLAISHENLSILNSLNKKHSFFSDLFNKYV